MRPRTLLWIGAGLCLLLLWLLPALLLSIFGPQISQGLLQIEVAGVGPAFPFGVHVDSAQLRHPSWKLDLHDASLTWLPFKLWGQAGVGDGRVDLDAAGSGASGRLELQGVPLQEIPLKQLTSRFSMTGRADGQIQWDEEIHGHLWVSEGEIRDPALMGFPLPFSLLVLKAARNTGRTWRLETLQLHGPPLTLDGDGTLQSSGALNVELTIRSVDESIQGMLRAFGMQLGTLPRRVIIGGTVASPRVQMP